MWLLGEHLPFGLLADLAEGRARPTQGEHEHLHACARCSADLAWLEHVISLARDASIEEPPADVVARIKTLFRERRRQAAAPRLLYTLLRFDSAQHALAYGLRSGGALERQLLLSAEGYDIDLRIVESGGLWQIIGQLLPTAADSQTTGSRVELLGIRGGVATELSELSEFSMPPVRAGHYNLTITLRDGVILIPGLELGA
jgi:hypothetical protein